jgi:hypothetical protein
MPSPNLDALFPSLLPRLPSCPYDLVRNAVREAARRFCRDSKVWRVFLPPIPVVDGQGTYALTPEDANIEVVDVHSVKNSAGLPLHPKTLDQLARVLPNWSSAVGSPVWFSVQLPMTLTVHPTPMNTPALAVLNVRVVQAPTMASGDLDPLLTVRYSEALVAGALANLFAMTDEAWSRPREVDKQTANFLRDIDLAKIDVVHEHAVGNLVVQPRRFGRP